MSGAESADEGDAVRLRASGGVQLLTLSSRMTRLTAPPKASLSPLRPKQQQVSAVLSADDRSILNYLKGTTINVSLDGYYAYNFNDPVGRVNLLRAYDVSSNAFRLNQAAVIFERAPDVDAGRRFGARLDLQFGQATATLQGNPVNETASRHLSQCLSGLWNVCSTDRQRADGRFRQMGKFSGDRRQLHAVSNQLFALRTGSTSCRSTTWAFGRSTT